MGAWVHDLISTLCTCGVWLLIVGPMMAFQRYTVFSTMLLLL